MPKSQFYRDRDGNPVELSRAAPNIPGVDQKTVEFLIAKLDSGKTNAGPTTAIHDGEQVFVDKDKYFDLLDKVAAGEPITLDGVKYGNEYVKFNGETFDSDSNIVIDLLNRPANYGQTLKGTPPVGRTEIKDYTPGKQLDFPNASTGDMGVAAADETQVARDFNTGESTVSENNSQGDEEITVASAGADAKISARIAAPTSQNSLQKAAPGQAWDVKLASEGDDVFMENVQNEIDRLIDNGAGGNNKTLQYYRNILNGSAEPTANDLKRFGKPSTTRPNSQGQYSGNLGVNVDPNDPTKLNSSNPNVTLSGNRGAALESAKDFVNNPAAQQAFSQQENAAAAQLAAQREQENKLKNALDIINNSNLPDDLKNMFANIARTYDPAKDVNVQNILDEFNRIKSTTIDPKFKQLSDIFISDLNNAKQEQEQQRALELEQEATQAGLNIRGSKSDLEARGLTFSGEAIRQLGKESAFAQTGQSVIPLQQAFGGAFLEGLVPQSNRFVATSNAARYQSNRRALGRQAEDVLGTSGVDQFGLPTSGVSGVTGSLEDQKQQALASALSGLAGQQSINTQAYQYNPNFFQ